MSTSRRRGPFMRLTHSYDDRDVELSLWIVEPFSGTPAALDRQRLKWVAPAQLPDEDLLEADRPFIAALRRSAAPRLNGAGAQRVYNSDSSMAAQNDLPEVQLDPKGLYREDVFTDRRAGSIRRLTPVTADGSADATRDVLFSGRRNC